MMREIWIVNTVLTWATVGNVAAIVSRISHLGHMAAREAWRLLSAVTKPEEYGPGQSCDTNDTYNYTCSNGSSVVGTSVFLMFSLLGGGGNSFRVTSASHNLCRIGFGTGRSSGSPVARGSGIGIIRGYRRLGRNTVVEARFVDRVVTSATTYKLLALGNVAIGFHQLHDLQLSSGHPVQGSEHFESSAFDDVSGK